MPRRPLTVIASLAVAALLLLLAPPASAATTVAKPYDFNGDGYPELVVGTPRLQVGSREQAGGVVVLPASRKGLSLKEKVVTESSPDVVGESGAGDQFGDSFASADFDRDGYADLAVGRPGEQADHAGGAVTILFGTAKGLTGKRSAQLFEPTGASVRFGSAITTGDFDRDGWPDLAVGDPSGDRLVFGDGDLTSDATGSVSVFSGGRAGFATARSKVFRGKRALADHDVDFGSTLAAADLDADGRAELVIGSAGQSYQGDVGDPGSVTLCSGTSTGLAGCIRVARDADYAGLSSVAVGNVSGTSRPEIVLGVPVADLDVAGGGAVETLTLSGRGAQTTASRSELTQDSPGVPGSDEPLDQFGTDVALGDLDGDGYDDLVVGAPWEDVGSREDAGRVTVVYGGATGYRASGNKLYDQNTKGVPGKAEKYDSFGATVALFDHDQDGHLDLTVGAPREDSDKGAATTLRGSGKSFTTRGARTFGLKKLGYAKPAMAGFGEFLGR